MQSPQKQKHYWTTIVVDQKSTLKVETLLQLCRSSHRNGEQESLADSSTRYLYSSSYNISHFFVFYTADHWDLKTWSLFLACRANRQVHRVKDKGDNERRQGARGGFSKVSTFTSTWSLKMSPSSKSPRFPIISLLLVFFLIGLDLGWHHVCI